METRLGGKPKRIVVIGAGIGGLATAALLGHAGHQVTVIEKNDAVGGRAMVRRLGEFVFDAGPSWYLMPDIFDRYFQLFDRKTSDFYNLQKLDPQYRIFFGDGEVIDISSDLARNVRYFESVELGAGERLKEYLDIAHTQYDLAIQKFLYTSFDNWLDFLHPQIAWAGLRMRLFQNLDSFTRSYFRSEKLRQILQYTNVFLGGSPKNTPATFCLMSYIDFCQGVYYPMDGMGKIVDALSQLCEENKVTILTGKDVSKIHVVNGVAQGVTTNTGEYFNADIVVSNGDYHHTETQLLESRYQSYPELYWQKATIAPSALILYLGVKGKVKNLKHHSLFFAHDWQGHFDEIFARPDWPTDPSYYVCTPSLTDPSVAPQGYENMFILIPVAAGLDDTDGVRERLAERVLSHLEMTSGESIRDRIVLREYMSQRDFMSYFHSYQGSALGLSHTLMQSAFWRPGNKSKRVDNLYHVGQDTTPGVGVPMCLIGAENVTKRITKEQASIK